MAAWSEGYFTDIQYTGAFYPPMAPGYLAFACLRQGVRPPELGPGASYLELGCGQGYGLNLMAAANPAMRFLGVDFHPGQIANASRLAGEAGLANVGFEDLSFEQALALPEGRLPRCEVIALHGIYSWVSRENRAAVVRLIDRLLKPGGLVYVSYNCLPGWAPLVPLQRFIAGHVARSTGDPRDRVIAALQAALQMAEDQVHYFHRNPALKPAIERALKEPGAYLVHEYLNDHSEPQFHAEVARDLEAARLSYAATANLADDLRRLAAPPALHKAIQEAADRTWRETLLDYASPKLFRRDIFVRGRNAPPVAELSQLLAKARFALLTPAEGQAFEFRIPMGQLKGDPEVYGPIVEALSDGPRSYGELAALPALARVPAAAFHQAIGLLFGARRIHPVSGTEAGHEAAVGFNHAVLARQPHEDFPGHLASGLTGTGVRVAAAEVLTMRAEVAGETDLAQVAARAAAEMARNGSHLLMDGEPVSEPAAIEAELAARIAAARAKLPFHRGLGMI